MDKNFTEKILDYIDLFFQYTTFWKVPFVNLPISIFLAIILGFYLTIKFGFAPFTLFGHAIKIVRDKFTVQTDPGAFTPKQAIYTAALGTVGLGSVGGMAVAISMGGPGAVFWVVVMGFFLSSLKFADIFLGHRFRDVNQQAGTADGGPFKYIDRSFEYLKMPFFGKIIGKTYAFIMIIAAFVTTNMFQCGQTSLIMTQNFPFLANYTWIMGGLAVILIGFSIIGGSSGVAKIAGALVPFMTVSYILSTIIILVFNFANLGNALLIIFQEAFNLKALTGGFFGGLAYGSLRSLFTTESGSGTSAIAHSSAKTKDPVMEGCTGFIEILFPMTVCFMTGLIIVVTESYKISGLGVVMTANAFSSVASWFPYLLTLQVPFLALTTAIAWGMYGEKTWNYFFAGKLPGWLYKVIFLICSFVGFIAKDQSIVVRTGDYIWITMCVPNLIVIFLMRNFIGDHLKAYVKKLKAGEIKEVDQK